MATFWLGHIRKHCTAMKKTHVTNTDTLTNLENIILSDKSASRVVGGFRSPGEKVLFPTRKHPPCRKSLPLRKGAGICRLSANISSLSPHGALHGALSDFTEKEKEAHSYQGIKLGSKPVLSMHLAVPLWSHSQATPTSR